MDRIRQPVTGSIKALEEILKSLRITEDSILEQSNRLVERINNMFRTQTLTVLEVLEATIPKNIVSDLGWFDKD